MAYNRIKPVFADINPRTFNVTADAIRARLTERTSVIIPVHFAGQACDMVAIAALARKRRIPIVEDAAHAIGSTYSDGSRVGNCRFSCMTVFSFHPVKTITTGEGGAVTTNDAELHARLMRLRSHGITRDPARLSRNPGPWYYEQQELGHNYRLADTQCALGLSQLAKLDRFKTRRREIVAAYNRAFVHFRGVRVPFETKGLDSCFHLYTLQVDFSSLGLRRTTVMRKLAARGVGTQVLYIPVYTHPWYRRTYGYREGECPAAEAYYRKALSLPLYPRMTADDTDRVIAAVSQVVGVRPS
jgi:dTDP-4-amino-4,6-dideoxygalactose transaminase